MYLIKRDNDLLDTLVFKVRLLSFKQIVTFYWGDSKSSKISARKRLNELVSKKLLHREQSLTYPVFTLTEPLYTWRPGQPWPDYEILSEYLNHRWSQQEIPVITSVYFASKKAVNCLGGYFNSFDRSRGSHNLNVSQIYLNLWKNNCLSECLWIGEANLTETDEKNNRIPDAILKNKNESDVAVRFASKLSVERLESLHEYHVKNEMRYQLW